MAASSIVWSEMFALFFGGFLVTASSNGFNQVIERELDKLMERTKNRPIPTGKMNAKEGVLVASIMGIIGLYLLFAFTNPLAGILGSLALFLYVVIYTPMKRITPFAVLIGAFPGAIPPMLGYIAATGTFGLAPGVLFAVQFIWQFPHFWAIAWVGYDDYAKAGYYLLPTRKKDRTATQVSIVYTLWMLFVSVLPAFGITGALTLSWPAALVVLVLGLDVLWAAWKHHRSPSDEAARKLMFATIRYLPMVQITYVVNHYLA